MVPLNSRSLPADAARLRDALEVIAACSRPQVQSSRSRRSDIPNWQNRLTEAERIALEARNEARHLGETHPATKAAATNLVAIYEKEGKREAAQPGK